MNTAVAILGLNGSGKSTLAHALALATGYREMDAEDYYFPTSVLPDSLRLRISPIRMRTRACCRFHPRRAGKRPASC